MKRILLLLSLLLAAPAYADDAVSGWTWNAVLNLFQAKTASLGQKNVPEQFFGSFSTTVSNGTTSPSVAYTVTRTGNIVTLHVGTPTTNVTMASTTNLQLGAQLPTWARPKSPVQTAALVINNNASEVGTLRVDSSGFVLIYHAPYQSFTSGTANCGWWDTSFTYAIQ